MAKRSGRPPSGGARPATSDAVVDLDPESRPKRFMKSALAILGETGRTDFTVLEVVERSKTSLRSFYQHFSTKDELLLALVDKIMSESTRKWREDTAGLPAVDALRILIDRICTPAETTTQDKVNRGLTFYNDRLAEALPSEYARVLSPVHELIKDIIHSGIDEGRFRTDIDIDATAALIMQSALGAMRLRVLGAELSGVPVDADHIYDFCVSSLPAAATPPDLHRTGVRRESGVKKTSTRRGVFAGPDVVMSLPLQPRSRLPGGGNDPRTAVSGVRRRQPLLRAQRGADPVPAGSPQGRHRLHRRPRTHQDHGAQRRQRLHPQPDVRGGRPARRPGGVLPARQRRQELPRGDGQAHEGDSRLPQSRGPHRGDGQPRAWITR